MSEATARWRYFADRAKRSRLALGLADALGRGRGHFRFVDSLSSRGLPAPRHKPDLADWTSRGTSAVWIGHATILFRIGGLTILTDPVFSSRIGIGLGIMTAGPRRLLAPAVALSALPPVDVVLLSHAHFDHLDRPTLARLPRSSRVVISAGNRDLVDDLGFSALTELAVGKSLELGGVKVTAVPVKHWGARVFHDTHRGFCAYMLESGGKRILFGADSAYQEMWRGLGPVDLCCVGIGAYDPWVAAHATPEQAAEMARHAGARRVLPMHHSTFKLSHEPVAEPLRRFRAVADAGWEVGEGGEVGAQWFGD
jgi:L-ascorbate metabolism protein UlaG (beta-lactamase superfamily)